MGLLVGGVSLPFTDLICCSLRFNTARGAATHKKHTGRISAPTFIDFFPSLFSANLLPKMTRIQEKEETQGISLPAKGC